MSGLKPPTYTDEGMSGMKPPTYADKVGTASAVRQDHPHEHAEA